MAEHDTERVDAEKAARRSKTNLPLGVRKKAAAESDSNQLGQGAQTAGTEAMLGLQQTHGNAYVQRLLKSRAVQAKLTVNPPDDQYEREADRVAETVAKASRVQREAQPEEEEEKVQSKLQRQAVTEEEEERVQTKLQRQADEEEEEKLQTKLQRESTPEEEEEKIQTKASDSAVPEVTQNLEDRINAARGSGEAVPGSVRASFEPRFGRDFSDVRVHGDSEADGLSRQLGAKAFTVGKDIFFRSGDYQPNSDEGRRLLGHEMTHVVQQGSAPVSRKDDEERDKATSEPSQGATKWGQGQEIGPDKPEKEKPPTREVCIEAVQYVHKIHKEGLLLTEDQVRETVRIQFVYLRDNFYMSDFELLKLTLAGQTLARPATAYQDRKLLLCKKIEREAREQVFSLLITKGEPFLDAKSEYAELKELPAPSGYD